MTEPTKQKPCGWLFRDPDGRPHCKHGRAVSSGPNRWACREGNARRRRAYRATDKGKEHRRRENASPQTQSHKALYDLTRVRPQ